MAKFNRNWCKCISNKFHILHKLLIELILYKIFALMFTQCLLKCPKIFFTYMKRYWDSNLISQAHIYHTVIFMGAILFIFRAMNSLNEKI